MTAKILVALLLALVDRALAFFETKKVKEQSDAQRENDNTERGGASGVAKRLRDKLAKLK
jgi:hypothetical protein